MREHKFRFWDTFDKKEPRMIYFNFHKLMAGSVYPDMETVMQSTGLKDKNGKEIYEGDILKEDDITTEIVFRNLAWQEKLISSPRNHLNDYFPLNQNITRTSLFGEVIGNIYENPELLQS